MTVSELSVEPHQTNSDTVWDRIREETRCAASKEPILASFLHATILHHDELECALSFHLANQLDSPSLSSMMLAVLERDSATDQLSLPFLYFKGFQALQTHRVGHWLWQRDRRALALFLQSRMSSKFGVDIHPAARFGHGVMLDHGSGLVVGETAVIGNRVSILQCVTLGGTGKQHGDRHPKIGDDVLISAGAKILGNINVGEGAIVGAGSVVLKDVPAHTTAAGVPARVVGTPSSDSPALEMDHAIPDNKW